MSPGFSCRSAATIFSNRIWFASTDSFGSIVGGMYIFSTEPSVHSRWITLYSSASSLLLPWGYPRSGTPAS